jgi:benzoyl-CoA 2,3-dioxygenase component B
MSTIDYSEKIPNNVNLSEDRTLQRALEQWQPNYLQWWDDMGPDGSQNFDVYLRTAISVDPQGWAQFGHVKMPDYRWGIFLNPAEKDRKIHFGDHKGEDAWQDVPGEHRANLRRIIVTQGDTEPASVEQQRHLGLTCPSQYDLRNLFQVNVEEGRHLWAMVYLLHKYFGRDGREEGEALLERRSGNEDNPRILQAFNEKTPDWLSFFMFTYFTDRDGKFQLCALAESSFDPLARTTKFMLTEEAHHMFVGESGVSPRHPAHLPGHERAEDRRPGQAARRRRDRPADDPALPELPLQRHHRPVRRRRVQQRRHLLQHRPEGPLRRRQAQRRPRAQGPDLPRAERAQRPAGREGSADAQRAERSAARRLHQGQRAGVERWNKVIEKAGIPFR